jgi:hypothetical protein
MFHTVVSRIIFMIHTLFTVLCFVSPFWSKHVVGYFYKNKICYFDIVRYSRESIWTGQLRWWRFGHEERTVGFGQRRTLPRSTENFTASSKIVVLDCTVSKIYNDRYSYVRRTVRCSCTVSWQHYVTANWQTFPVDAFLAIVARLQAAMDCRAFENIVTVLVLLMFPHVGKSTVLFEGSQDSLACPYDMSLKSKMRMEQC